MPSPIQPSKAEGRGAHPKQPAVCYGIHGWHGIPRVADSQHVIKQARDAQGSEAARVCIGEVVECDEEPRP